MTALESYARLKTQKYYLDEILGGQELLTEASPPVLGQKPHLPQIKYVLLFAFLLGCMLSLLLVLWRATTQAGDASASS